MGSSCSREHEETEYSAMVAMRQVTEADSDMTYMTQSREETLRSLKTGDLIFIRIGDYPSDNSIGWIRCGVIVYAPTQLPGEGCHLVECQYCYDDGLVDAMKQSKIEEGIRVVSFSELVSTIPSHWSVYVRRLEGPTNYTTTRRRHNYNSDRAQADTLTDFVKTATPSSRLMQELLSAFGFVEHYQDPISYEQLAKQEIKTRGYYNYRVLEKIF